MVQELLVQMDFLKFISQITELDQRDEGWLTLFFRAKWFKPPHCFLNNELSLECYLAFSSTFPSFSLFFFFFSLSSPVLEAAQRDAVGPQIARTTCWEIIANASAQGCAQLYAPFHCAVPWERQLLWHRAENRDLGCVLPGFLLQGCALSFPNGW